MNRRGGGGYNSGGLGPGQWQSNNSSQNNFAPDANMMMQQIQQLQQTVRELQTGAAGHGQPGYGGNNGGGGFGSGSGLLTPGTQGHSNYQSGGGGGTWSNNGFGGVRREYGGDRRGYGGGNKKPQEPIKEEEQTVLLVSNIPPNLSNPDSLFYAFEKFGSVERVKVLHNKRTTALVQMSQPAEAQRAVEEQDSLNRTGSEIYVNFSSNFSEITVPSPGSNYDNGLAKDFSITAPGAGTMPPPPAPEFGDNFAGGFNNDGGARGGGRGMFSDHGNNRAGAFDEFTMMGSRGGQGGGVVLLVSNLPDEVANVDCIFNMIGMYGDVMYVKILRNKKDCCMVQLAKPHHAQQVKQFLDGAKIGGNKLCISYSRVETFLNKRIPEDDENQREFLNSRNHRYRNQNIAAKLLKNLGPPTCTLHVANLPEGYSHLDIKNLFLDKGFTIKESSECGASGNMALLTMASPEEALMALAVMHNYCQPDLKFRNSSGLCVSFSTNKGKGFKIE